MINFQDFRQQFRQFYGNEPRLFSAPGRVNLIGEHTDYNDGFVLPMAIESETLVAAAVRNDQKIRVHSVNLNEEFEINLEQPEQKLRNNWIDYVEGMVRILERQNIRLNGADLLIYSNVPTGAGLSSSAALEMSVGLALTEICEQPIDKVRLALIGQAAEHEFVGANVGIMDQFISAMGKQGHALLIDCRNLSAEQVPFASTEIAVVICNSNVKHELAESEYNTRRAECEEGVIILQKFLPNISQLRDVNLKEFELYQTHLPEIIRRRCRHIITENQRTLDAAKVLKVDNLTEFGRLMNLSHLSMCDDFEISCKELDLLVEIAQNCQGVLGTRMTGGGFGGSTVNLVKKKNLAEFIEKISHKYEEETTNKPSIYPTNAADGASEVE